MNRAHKVGLAFSPCSRYIAVGSENRSVGYAEFRIIFSYFYQWMSRLLLIVSVFFCWKTCYGCHHMVQSVSTETVYIRRPPLSCRYMFMTSEVALIYISWKGSVIPYRPSVSIHKFQWYRSYWFFCFVYL